MSDVGRLLAWDIPGIVLGVIFYGLLGVGLLFCAALIVDAIMARLGRRRP